MTSVATVAGAVPGALSLGPGGELRIPMSVAVIGGVIVSTFLTLFVVPCFYSVAEDWRTRITHVWRVLRGARDVRTLGLAVPALGSLCFVMAGLAAFLPAL